MDDARIKFWPFDLKTKMVAVCIALFVGAIWLLAHDVAEEVSSGFQKVVAAEQMALVEHITDTLDEESRGRASFFL